MLEDVFSCTHPSCVPCFFLFGLFMCSVKPNSAQTNAQFRSDLNSANEGVKAS